MAAMLLLHRVAPVADLADAARVGRTIEREPEDRLAGLEHGLALALEAGRVDDGVGELALGLDGDEEVGVGREVAVGDPALLEGVARPPPVAGHVAPEIALEADEDGAPRA